MPPLSDDDDDPLMAMRLWLNAFRRPIRILAACLLVAAAFVAALALAIWLLWNTPGGREFLFDYFLCMD